MMVGQLWRFDPIIAAGTICNISKVIITWGRGECNVKGRAIGIS